MRSKKLLLATVLAFCLMPASSVRADSSLNSLPTSADAVKPLAVGSTVPTKAAVRDLDGKSLELGSILAGKPSVLIFYRGGW